MSQNSIVNFIREFNILNGFGDIDYIGVPPINIIMIYLTKAYAIDNRNGDYLHMSICPNDLYKVEEILYIYRVVRLDKTFRVTLLNINSKIINTDVYYSYQDKSFTTHYDPHKIIKFILKSYAWKLSPYAEDHPPERKKNVQFDKQFVKKQLYINLTPIDESDDLEQDNEQVLDQDIEQDLIRAPYDVNYEYDFLE